MVTQTISPSRTFARANPWLPLPPGSYPTTVPVIGIRSTVVSTLQSVMFCLHSRGIVVERPRLAKSAVQPARSSRPAPPASALQPAPKKIPLGGEFSDPGLQVLEFRLLLLGALPALACCEHLWRGIE